MLSLYRQKEMQHQLEKITDLVRLIVQKLGISTDIVTEDRSTCDNQERSIKIQKLRHTFNAARRFSRFRSSINKDSSQSSERAEKM